jgi:hypothetical protein
LRNPTARQTANSNKKSSKSLAISYNSLIFAALHMGVYLGFIFVGVPCILFLIFSYTPLGRKWLEQHNIL